MSLKSYVNRCRCCLEKFFDDERVSKITNFFEAQFRSFTGGMDLIESEVLSQHVCEFCHAELLRFSVFKKDLIEKQQKLYELLKQHHEKRRLKGRLDSPEPSAIVISDEDDSGQEIEQSEDSDDGDLESSDDHTDRDYLIVPAERSKAKPATSQLPQYNEQLVCDYCQVIFRSKAGLVRHVQSHVDFSDIWKCDEPDCKYGTSTKQKLKVHKQKTHRTSLASSTRKHPVKKPVEYKCFCGLTFDSKYVLLLHNSRCHPKREICIYGCPNMQYVKTGHYLRHVEAKHPEKLEEAKRLTCREGKKKTATPAPPISISTPSPPPISPATPTPPPISLSTPTPPPFEEEKRIFQCDKCDFKAETKLLLEDHIKSHPELKYQCEECLKLFKVPSALKLHGETIHKQIRRFKCKTCPGVSFKQSGHLVEHVANKHPEVLNKKHFIHKCVLCHRSFHKRYMLNKHVRSSHKVDPNQLAEVPLASLNGKRKLRIIPTHKCHCGKFFASAARLENHKNLVHVNKKLNPVKYNCPFKGCESFFLRKCNLTTHQKEKGHLTKDDLSKMKYWCCDKGFFTYHGYVAHCEKGKCRKKAANTFASAEKPN